ncbi:hypothetical protein [Natronobiforma cellulositropha]|uniref:hypothetical protein n=1 Tax=Natronobiforma cellulositropha TaxID=1679076 RepID=UPI0021D5FCB2|nr:hypothetical protein [Natronobiforma cellulositropha]
MTGDEAGRPARVRTDAATPRARETHRPPVTLPELVLARYDRLSLYNSPYPAHDRGCAIDLYPGGERAPSPVAGVVREVKTVRAPPRPYAPTHDHLLVLECHAPAAVSGLLARILHVDPAVGPGQTVAVGEDLGRLVRAGFFAPWVARHLHVGFRRPDQNPYRARGSLPIALESPVLALEWDGTGTVCETGETYAVLDAPAHPDPGAGVAGVAADGGGALDGGLPHYDRGGLFCGPDGPVHLCGERVGTAHGRIVSWADTTVTVDGDPITGLSLSLARAATGVKLVASDHGLAVGDTVEVGIDATTTD